MKLMMAMAWVTMAWVAMAGDGLPVKRGEGFEIRAQKFLQERFSSPGLEFARRPTADSTGSDIEVLKDGKRLFFIEAKSAAAQAGQFVLSADERARKFEFSRRNKSHPTAATERIIRSMNDEFDRFNAAGTAGVPVEVPKEVVVDCIVGHYRQKGVRFVVSEFEGDFVLLPLERFGEYFAATATYRTKNSGSGWPRAADLEGLVASVAALPGVTGARVGEAGKGKRSVLAEAPSAYKGHEWRYGGRRYRLSPLSNDTWVVRQLSETKNRNVIFAIRTVQGQDGRDVEAFRREIQVRD